MQQKKTVASATIKVIETPCGYWGMESSCKSQDPAPVTKKQKLFWLTIVRSIVKCRLKQTKVAIVFFLSKNFPIVQKFLLLSVIRCMNLKFVFSNFSRRFLNPMESNMKGKFFKILSVKERWKYIIDKNYHKEMFFG